MKKFGLILFLLSILCFSQNNSQDSDDQNYASETVDKSADFEGGINVFRTLIMNNFIWKNVKCAEGIQRTTSRFIIERDGTISNVKTKSEIPSISAEIERVIRSIDAKWQPAVYKGVQVRSHYSLPVTLNCND
jgi:protein TonB